MASDTESDGFGAYDLSEFTPDDFAQIDSVVACHFQPTKSTNGSSTAIANSTADQVGGSSIYPSCGTRSPVADESFEFDMSLDLSKITEEDLTEIDKAVARHLSVASASPIPTAAVLPEVLPGLATSTRDPTEVPRPSDTRWRYKGKKKAWEDRSLLEKFRPSNILSVTDLTAPVWCVAPDCTLSSTFDALRKV